MLKHEACWPSRWGWGGFLFLLAYAIFMHSFHDQEHAKHREVEEQLSSRVTLLEQSIAALEVSLEVSKVSPVVKKRWWQR